MPTGVYVRTKPQSKKQMEQIRTIAKRPRTEKQCETSRKNVQKAQKIAHKLPRTQKQIKACCKNFIKAREIGSTLPRTPKQLAGKVFGNDIVEHHNDLCHGAERPEDVTYMIMREHSRLHNNLRVLQGTHCFLTKNKVISKQITEAKGE